MIIIKANLLIAVFCLSGSCLFAQPLTMHAPVENTDTVVRYVDVAGRVQPRENAAYLQKTWPQNGKYQLHLYTNNADNRIVRKAVYADVALQELDGPFENYHPNGQLKDSGCYAKKLRNGLFKTWYESGQLNSIFQYANGIKVDTGKTFTDKGNLAGMFIADRQGNGVEINYYSNGNVRLTGPVSGGVKNGTWTLKRENGTNMMQIEFARDSVAQTTCFGEDGKTPADGPCIYERFARFPGGTEGWRNFLMANLKYPQKAIQSEIQGTVMLEFTIDTTGQVGDIKVLSSPNELLTKEALRLMAISPKWETAIQYNRKVKGRLRQPIYFRLE